MYEKYAHLRDEQGLTDYAVAKATGIGRSSFNDWKTGRSKLKADKIQKLADFFHVPVTYFYGEQLQPVRQRGDFPELPEPAEIMAAVKGKDIELPVLLALWLSFSMSEVLGLTAADIHGDIIYINRTRIYMGNEVIDKNTAKVDTRKRAHKIPPYLMGLINNTEAVKNYAETGENSPLVAMPDYTLRYRFQQALKAAGVKPINFHKLRHLNASIMLQLGVPDKYAMERGGWKTSHVMKTVYQHTLSPERQRVDGIINEYFDAALHTNSAHDSRKALKNADL